MDSGQDGYTRTVRRFFRRLAVYFGVKEDDTVPDPGVPVRELTALRLVGGAVVAGALYALITAALDGFDASLAKSVLRGAFFGVTMTAIWLAIHRFGERDRSDDTKS
jgi:hypothetical protein